MAIIQSKCSKFIDCPNTSTVICNSDAGLGEVDLAYLDSLGKAGISLEGCQVYYFLLGCSHIGREKSKPRANAHQQLLSKVCSCVSTL